MSKRLVVAYLQVAYYRFLDIRKTATQQATCQSSRPIIEQNFLVYTRKYIMKSVLLANVKTRVFKKLTVAEMAKLHD